MVSSTIRLDSAARLPSMLASTSTSTTGLSDCSEVACQTVLPQRSASAWEEEEGVGGGRGVEERERERGGAGEGETKTEGKTEGRLSTQQQTIISTQQKMIHRVTAWQ